jgi:uncharacterized phage-like protein YoqJ
MKHLVKKIGVSGHRPQSMPGGFTKRNEWSFIMQERTDSFFKKEHEKIALVNVGLALGFDTFVAMACIKYGIPYDAYIGYPGQADQWTSSSKQTFDMLLKKARTVYIEADTVSSYKDIVIAMHSRNRKIVDNSDEMLIFYNWVKKGGTYQTYKYAEKMGKNITNLYE